MTRIRTIPLADADDALRIAREAQHALYPPEYATPVPPLVDEAGGIVSAHSLIPDALLPRLRHVRLADGARAPARPSPAGDDRHRRLRDQPDLLLHRLAHGVPAPGDRRRRTWRRPIRRDFRTAPISDADRAMLEYAEQITLDATGVTDEHHAQLRAAGFDDRGILQITLIAAWFNYINRVADALGVGTTPT